MWPLPTAMRSRLLASPATTLQGLVWSGQGRLVRSISSSLKSAQQSTSVEPYIHIYFTKPGGGHYDGSHRLVQLEHHEEPYNDWADIFLHDTNRVVPDLKGAWIEIGYGAHIVHGGVEYADTPRLWVKTTELVSREGDLFMVLHCEGMWSHLGEIDMITKGEPPRYEGRYEEEYSVYDTIKDVLAAVDYTLNDIGDQSDGIIDVLAPMIYVNKSPFENPAEVIYRLIAMTKCFLRPLTNLEMEIRFPQDSDSIDEHYSSSSPHYFHEYRERLNITIPNHIVVYGNASGDDDDWDIIVAKAEDEDAIKECKLIAPPDGKITKHHIAADLDNITDAENRASAILTRVKFESLAGRLIIPHDCRVELYDRVGIYDSRSG